MLAPVKHALSAHRIILASSSPRRQELMQNLGLNVELLPSLFEENLNPSDFPSLEAFVEDTAYYKALDVWTRVQKPGDATPVVVIAADTIVALNGKVFGKPGTAERAVEMLTELSGKPHQVYTGVVLKHNKGEIRFYDTTKVFFGKVTAEQIKAYVDTGEPLFGSTTKEMSAASVPQIKKIQATGGGPSDVVSLSPLEAAVEALVDTNKSVNPEGLSFGESDTEATVSLNPAVPSTSAIACQPGKEKKSDGVAARANPNPKIYGKMLAKD